MGVQDYTCDCGSTNTTERPDATGLRKCFDCGNYFEIEPKAPRARRAVRRFDDDDSE